MIKPVKEWDNTPVDPYDLGDGHGKTQRRILDIDVDMIEEKAAKGCTQAEIASLIGIRQSHMNRLKTQYPEIQEAIDRGKAKLAEKLRNKQVDVALEGNPQLLIHLGKCYLGQDKNSDKDEHGKIEIKLTWGNEVKEALEELQNEAKVLKAFKVGELDVSQDE